MAGRCGDDGVVVTTTMAVGTETYGFDFESTERKSANSSVVPSMQALDVSCRW